MKFYISVDQYWR